MKKAITVLTAAAIILLAAIFTLKIIAPKVQKRTRFMLDTVCTIQAPGGRNILKKIDAALDRMEEIDNKLSAFKTESPVYRFNKTGEPISDPETVYVIKTALEVAEKTNGLFDITISPVVKAWGFYTGLTPSVASDQAIKEALKKTGWKYLEIKEGKVYKRKPWIEIDLGGIGKGYACEQAAAKLKELGVKSALIDGGGNIVAIGKLRGKPWKIGVRNPRGDGVIAALDAEDVSIVTSGDYERFFEKDGVRYHHIMDPRTGYPARKSISVTVMAESSMIADAWTKPIFILGPEDGLKLAESLPFLECMIIDDKGNKFLTKGLK